MKKLLLIITIIFILGIIPLLVQYGVFFMPTDYGIQQIPFILETKRMLASGAPWWSWNTYFGDNFICGYFSFLTSPFVWIASLFPSEFILQGLSFVLLLKFLVLGVVAYTYLRRIEISNKSSVIGSILYTFSSYTIGNLYYCCFLESQIVFPVVLYSIEAFLNQEKKGKYLVVLSTFLSVCAGGAYMLPCILFPALLYGVVRYYAIYKESKNVKIIICAVSFSILGVLLASFVIFPTVIPLSNSPRASLDFGLDRWSLINILERFRALFMPAVIEGPLPPLLGTAWYSNVANIGVCGVLFAIIYCFKYKDWVSYLFLISVFLYLTPLNGIFSLYTNPTYSRWAFALSLFTIIPTVKILDEGVPVSLNSYLSYCGICLAVILIAWGRCLDGLKWYAIIIFVGYFICRIGLNRTVFGKVYDKLVSYLFITAIAFFIGVMFYRSDSLEPQYARYNSFALICLCIVSLLFLLLFINLKTFRNRIFALGAFMSIHMAVYCYCASDSYRNIADISKTWAWKEVENADYSNNDRFEYRVDFSNSNYYNKGLLNNIPSINTYSSIQNNSYRELFFAANSRIPVDLRSSLAFEPEEDYRDSFNALMSVRKIEVVDGTLYDNKNYIPMGFTYDTYLSYDTITAFLTSPRTVDIPRLLLENLYVQTADIPLFTEFMPAGNLSFNSDLDSLVCCRKQIVCSDFVGTTKGFTANIDMKKKNAVFFTVPFDLGFSAFIDGDKTDIYNVNLGLSAVIVPSGKHKIEFRYFPVGLKLGLWISSMALIVIVLIFLRGWNYTLFSKYII